MKNIVGFSCCVAYLAFIKTLEWIDRCGMMMKRARFSIVRMYLLLFRGGDAANLILSLRKFRARVAAEKADWSIICAAIPIYVIFLGPAEDDLDVMPEEANRRKIGEMIRSCKRRRIPVWAINAALEPHRMDDYRQACEGELR